ncbi:phosphotransferase, partial [Methylobacterium sp.]|uniref:phosphotransferase n=1 Tax=Methylobacterium sp. TaxID=409 RepID=UPI000FA1ECAE
DAFAARIVPALPDLPHQVVHNDLGGDNILVDPDDPDRITGVIDFGDMVRTARMFDVAIAAAYQLGLDADPLGPALAFLRGYASVARLSEAEVALLPTAIRTRMALRLLIPEWRARRFPERRDYLTRNSAGVWEQFRHLDDLAPEAMDAAIAEACRS